MLSNYWENLLLSRGSARQLRALPLVLWGTPGASLGAQLVKNPPAVREILVRSLGWDDPLEEGTAPHSSILAWRVPWTVQSLGSRRVGRH